MLKWLMKRGIAAFERQWNYDEHFTEVELVGLTIAIVAINGWNRVAIPFRAEAGSYQPATAEVAAAVSS